MKSKLNSTLLLLTFLLLLISMAWPRDSRSEDTALLCFPGNDAQRLLRIDEEASLKDQKIAILEQQVSNLEKENDLLKQQSAIQEKLTELAKREAEVYRTAFEGIFAPSLRICYGGWRTVMTFCTELMTEEWKWEW